MEKVGGCGASREGEVMADQNSRKMSRAEAGRKGGQTTKQRYGEDHFGKIGRVGGKKGGETTKQRYGSEFYQKIGRIGGSR
jgi:general stress protein YciG